MCVTWKVPWLILIPLGVKSPDMPGLHPFCCQMGSLRLSKEKIYQACHSTKEGAPWTCLVRLREALAPEGKAVGLVPSGSSTPVPLPPGLRLRSQRAFLECMVDHISLLLKTLRWLPHH